MPSALSSYARHTNAANRPPPLPKNFSPAGAHAREIPLGPISRNVTRGPLPQGPHMQNHETVAGWLRELGAKTGAGAYQLDDDGACLFDFNGLKAGLQVAETSGVVHLYAAVASPPEDDGREGFFEKLLSLNAFGVETGGASFAIHDQSGSIILWYNLPIAGADAFAFENTFGNFLEVAERWKDDLGQPGGEEADFESRNDASTSSFTRV